MALAQVVYQISRDREFAAQMLADPESALAQRGLNLSKEELAFLTTGISRKTNENYNVEDLAVRAAGGWFK